MFIFKLIFCQRLLVVLNLLNAFINKIIIINVEKSLFLSGLLKVGQPCVLLFTLSKSFLKET